MAAVTVSGAGGRTFSDIGMGGQAFGPTAFDPFGYRPGYFESFGTGGFYPGGLGGGELGYSGLGSPSSIDVYGSSPGFVPPVGIPNVWYSPTLFPYDTPPPGLPGGGPFPVPPPPLPNVPPPPGGTAPGSVSGTGQPVNWGPGVGTGQVSLTPGSPFSGGATGSGFGGVGPQFAGGGGVNLGGGGQYGGGGYGMGGSIGQYSPGAYSAGLSAALGQTGFFPSNPGSHMSFGAIAQGGGRIPFDTPAYLHQGERVIPANGDMRAANMPVRDWGWMPPQNPTGWMPIAHPMPAPQTVIMINPPAAASAAPARKKGGGGGWGGGFGGGGGGANIGGFPGSMPSAIVGQGGGGSMRQLMR
jgi:hypothetical protein